MNARPHARTLAPAAGPETSVRHRRAHTSRSTEAMSRRQGRAPRSLLCSSRDNDTPFHLSRSMHACRCDCVCMRVPMHASTLACRCAHALHAWTFNNTHAVTEHRNTIIVEWHESQQRLDCQRWQTRTRLPVRARMREFVRACVRACGAYVCLRASMYACAHACMCWCW